LSTEEETNETQTLVSGEEKAGKVTAKKDTQYEKMKKLLSRFKDLTRTDNTTSEQHKVESGVDDPESVPTIKQCDQ